MEIRQDSVRWTNDGVEVTRNRRAVAFCQTCDRTQKGIFYAEEGPRGG